MDPQALERVRRIARNTTGAQPTRTGAQPTRTGPKAELPETPREAAGR